jgi:hypothetical protein
MDQDQPFNEKSAEKEQNVESPKNDTDAQRQLHSLTSYLIEWRCDFFFYTLVDLIRLFLTIQI